MRSKTATHDLGASHELMLQDYAFIEWENQGLNYSLVGDLPAERLREISEHLRSTRILTRLPGTQGTAAVLISRNGTSNHQIDWSYRRHS